MLVTCIGVRVCVSVSVYMCMGEVGRVTLTTAVREPVTGLVTAVKHTLLGAQRAKHMKRCGSDGLLSLRPSSWGEVQITPAMCVCVCLCV